MASALALLHSLAHDWHLLPQGLQAATAHTVCLILACGVEADPRCAKRLRSTAVSGCGGGGSDSGSEDGAGLLQLLAPEDEEETGGGKF